MVNRNHRAYQQKLAGYAPAFRKSFGETISGKDIDQVPCFGIRSLFKYSAAQFAEYNARQWGWRDAAFSTTQTF